MSRTGRHRDERQRSAASPRHPRSVPPIVLEMPIESEIAIVMVSSATKKKRPSRPIRTPLQALRQNQTQEGDRRGCFDRWFDLGEQQRSQGQRDGDGDEEPGAHGEPRAGKAGDDHKASTNPAEHDEGREHQGRRQSAQDRSAQERAPSVLICAPRAISRWDRTGRVANMRSTIMRT